MNNEFLLSFRGSKAAMTGAVVLAILVIVAVAGPWITPHDPGGIDLSRRLRPPAFQSGGSWAYPLGTDELGRDILSRVIVGARITLLTCTISVVGAGIVGTLLGLYAGYRTGPISSAIMRLIEIEMAFPGLLLAATILVLIGPSFWAMVFVLVLGNFSFYGRIVRDKVLGLRSATYIESAEGIGCTRWRVMLRHLFPNTIPTLLTVTVLEFAHLVMAEAALSYLGFGIQPPSVTWGLMVASAQDYIQVAWWAVAFPGIALAITVLATNLLASWMGTYSDPRRRGTALPALAEGGV